ncbi:unnamed protein product [Clonostachys solani]|uniref:Transmembrane protein n=1 Tax=Clonostachys solani TaxID=160281 RepID=A0A9N9Z1I5_9HYPO|nr:unnamed protein product [Clonostachys solani]
MAKIAGIYWVKPASMVSCLIIGALLALGHHLFYQSLAGESVSSDGTFAAFGASISKQQTNTSIGTAISFLVKAFLVAAVSMAYIQVFWRAIKVGRPASDLHLSGLNTTSSAPATLSVLPSFVDPPPSSMVLVPNLDLESLSFVANMPASQGDYNTYLYNGPSQAVREVATAVAARGAILPIRPPEVNATWSLGFYGPSLQCGNVDDGLYQAFIENIKSYLHSGTNSVQCYQPYGYLAWFPRLMVNGTLDTVPLVNVSGTLSPLSGTMSQLGNGQNATMYLIALPDLFQVSSQITHTDPEACKSNGPNADQYWEQWTADGTMLQCQLINSTYHVNFTYTNGNQHINVSSFPTGDTITTANNVIGPSRGPDQRCPTLTFSNTSCEFAKEILGVLSFQAIMDAFSQNVVGAISISGGASADLTLDIDSRIMATSLVNTIGLSFLEHYAISTRGTGEYSSLQSELSLFDDPSVQGIRNSATSIRNQTLSDALEELFRNTVVSMMGSDALQPNMSSDTAPPPTKVTFQKVQNIYVYTAWKLWLPYGFAIVLATGAVAIGLFAMLDNRASYSHDFSTIFLVAKGTDVDIPIAPDDLEGEDPLPSYLGDARLLWAQRSAAHSANDSDPEIL